MTLSEIGSMMDVVSAAQSLTVLRPTDHGMVVIGAGEWVRLQEALERFSGGDRRLAHGTLALENAA